MLRNNEVMHQNVKCGRGGAGKCGAHRIVHKIEENCNFSNGRHAKTTYWKSFKSTYG